MLNCKLGNEMREMSCFFLFLSKSQIFFFAHDCHMINTIYGCIFEPCSQTIEPLLNRNESQHKLKNFNLQSTYVGWLNVVTSRCRSFSQVFKEPFHCSLVHAIIPKQRILKTTLQSFCDFVYLPLLA